MADTYAAPHVPPSVEYSEAGISFNATMATVASRFVSWAEIKAEMAKYAPEDGK